MFNKCVPDEKDIKTDGNGKKAKNKKDITKNTTNEMNAESMDAGISNSKVNTILKGSKLTGDINVTCDVELSGDIEGNIKAVQNSKIVIKGTCNGMVEAREGSVYIEGN